MSKAPICPYCGYQSHKVNGQVIYPHRPDLYSKVFYLCQPCAAYVGCHPGTDNPLGRLANSELRAAKSAAHRAFDKIWKEGPVSRGAAYRWLSQSLGIPKDQCHIGMFDVRTCDRVVELCRQREGRLAYEPRSC